MTYDALVVGAGPAGSTAAQLLARAGWSVAVVEKSRFPRRKVCGEFISAASIALLNELGVDSEFLASAGPDVRRVGLFAGDAAPTAAMPPLSGAPARWGRALGREHNDVLLRDAAVRAGATLWQPWKVVGLQRRVSGFVCTIAARNSTQELAARVVIAANGSWEHDPFPGNRITPHDASDLLAFKAHFTGSDLPRDLMPLLAFPGGYGGMVHSDQGRVSLSCCIRRDVLELCRKRYARQHAGEAVVQHICEACLGVRDALWRARLDGVWLAAGPIRPGIGRRFADGVFFVGNRAGEAHPIVAEGISMAAQSAWLLARRLVARADDALSSDAPASHALAEIAAAYAADWRAQFAARIRAAALFAALAARPSAVALLAPVLTHFPGILSFGAQLSGKTRRVVTAA
jgi:flavin-dependent dehydrogenase